jgi:hypothetical protein
MCRSSNESTDCLAGQMARVERSRVEPDGYDSALCAEVERVGLHYNIMTYLVCQITQIALQILRTPPSEDPFLPQTAALPN